MSATMTFRLKNKEDKEYVNEVINRIADIHKDKVSIKGDALKIMAKAFEEGIETIQFKEIPTSVQDVLNQVGCQFLKYEGDISGYMCYENMYKKKKGEPIGSIDEHVISRCQLCQEGKQVAIETKIQNALRKKNIKSILDLRYILINLTREFSLAQIYICKGNLLEEHEIIVCLDGIHLRCPLKEKEPVSVLEYCYNQVNPSTLNPPCRYLIDPYINVNMEMPEKAKEILEDLAQLEHSESNIKQVDAEVIEKEEEKEEENNGGDVE